MAPGSPRELPQRDGWHVRWRGYSSVRASEGTTRGEGVFDRLQAGSGQDSEKASMARLAFRVDLAF